MPLNYLLENQRMLVNRGYNDSDINKWAFWKFQYVIDNIIKASENKDKNSIENLNKLGS